MTTVKTNESTVPGVGLTPWKKAVFTKDTFGANSEGLHYVYLVGRTLSGDCAGNFTPDQVFYVGKYPAAYIKTVDCFVESDIREWQLFLWNQTVVPMLILQDRTKIRVYTANEPPLRADAEKQVEAILETTADALELLQTEIENGKFYEDHKDAFQRNTTVDQYLLDQLNATSSNMVASMDGGNSTANLEFIHRFLTRILFVCYLIERGMIKGSFFPRGALHKLCAAGDGSRPYLLLDLLTDLGTTEKRANAIFDLFLCVKEHFNGSLFPESLAKEKRYCKKAILDVLIDFLKGNDQENGQLSLGFWAYDFSVIPIETISSIYETFLKAQGVLNEEMGAKNSQRKAGAYYTPPHLAELTADIALDGIQKPIHELTVFDPSCGSGVFLVTMLGRMADSLRRKMKYKGKRPCAKWGSEIMNLLTRLHGLDINPTACHISCFSLYLAALEQMSPLDLEMLQKAGKKFPPMLLDKENGYTDGKNIVHANFFDENTPFDETFDLVIGNPPWVSRKNSTDEKFLKWRSSQGKIRETVLAPEKQIAAGFMRKTPEYLSKDHGRACLLLPSAVLLNKNTNHFQKEWLKTVDLTRVVNFSDLRRVLFERAIHPCIAVCFSHGNENPQNRICSYESP
ncbi:class I SAM-dependent DNA methyltransferase, partial [Pontiella sp.]|uniref:HsdM family class I SAM-dependent methyltransferase n=1 Tax=Pontiella sp. TaxID=2837462 RepID=UPI0035637787